MQRLGMCAIVATLIVALAAALSACGGGGAPTPPPSEGSATVDAAGGDVIGPDGVRLVVPAGALSTATTVRIARDGSGAPELGGAKAISPVYAVTPHGTAFVESARISIPFKADDVAPGTQPVLMRAQPGGGWEALATDVQGGTVSAADTPGLSYYTVGTCYTTRDAGVSGPDPLLYCPSAHTLQLTLYDGSGALVPVPRNGSGVAQPAMTITSPTNLSYTLSWTRPPGTQRSDRVWMQIADIGLLPSQQPLSDFAVNRDFTRTFTTTIDPATVPEAGKPGGKVIRLKASVVYTTDAFYPGCVCFKPASWNFTTEIPVRVIYTAPPPSPPVITQQPQNRSVVEGQTATFSVVATGANLTYQWSSFRGQAQTVITGATQASFTTPATRAEDDNTFFTVRVCPANATTKPPCVDSDAALLRVTQVTVAPTFTQAPQSISVIEGQTASFSATAGGVPAPTIDWSRERVSGPFVVLDPICSPTTGNGPSTSATCTIGPLTLADNGARIVAAASNPAGAVAAPTVVVTVQARPVAPMITTPAEPADRTVVAGGSVSWTVGASGTAPLSYAWRTVLPGGAVMSGIQCEDGYGATPNGATVTLANIPLACNGHRFFVVVSNATNPAAESRRALLTVTPAPAAPTITTALQNRSVLDGTQVTFNVVATGTPATFTYAWTFDGAAVPEVASGCTSASATCTFTARLPQTGKTVRVGVSNGNAPDASSSATLTVTTNDVAASITQQPANATTVEGGSAGFSIGVAGTPTPTVTWETSTDGVTWISAGTGTTFTITGATLAQNGLRVRARVSNTIATATGSLVITVPSGIVTLTVTPALSGMVLYAGDFSGSGSLDGQGANARFNVPEGLTADASGNLYVAETNGDRVARIAPGAVVTRIYDAAAIGRILGAFNVGSVAMGPTGDLFAAPVTGCGLYRINAPTSATPTVTPIDLQRCTGNETRGLAVDSQGRPHVSQVDSDSIFRVAASPVAGVFPTSAFVGADSTTNGAGAIDANGLNARFNNLRGIAFAPDGDLYVADSDNHTIRRVTPAGEVTTFAGTAGQRGTVDGRGTDARFNTPIALAFDAAGTLYVLEIGGPAPSNVVAYVRRLTPALDANGDPVGDVTTLFNATTEAQALASTAQADFAADIRGIAVLGSNRIALTSGNAILVRTLP